MEDLIPKIIDSVGPKWAQLYSFLGLDYRGRFQISTNNQSISPERVKHRQCALETIRKWQKEVEGKDEMECMQILLGHLQRVKGMGGLAMELANEYGVELKVKPSLVSSESHLSSSEESQREESFLYKSSLWSQPIDTRNRGHKFAVLDICQRMTKNHFKQFVSYLGLDSTRIEAIIREEPLLEEQYYTALKEIIESKGAAVTLNDLKEGLRLCLRHDLVALVMRRIEATRD
ncbi:PREDICTED: uncharacterized protein LOC100638322 [Amphimedon queenslandica]|uniref:Death domain-containing protein n=1 Tax=Amphimedon queenslandica TaxID=400682 RepID=A0A1X7SQ76_AMPQE|nr:PREDICTED: uncharacterized protein LOC100638322 [Amphimedon queenslandica]|eukprot:XP_003391780.1 PREDICTED: uncharacterized protein LOC100638322 [Amphimedon queenslandica]